MSKVIQGLKRDIIENPEDLSLRLILADALEEANIELARVEHIRLSARQKHLLDNEHCNRNWEELETIHERLLELNAENVKEWTPPTQSGVRFDWLINSGFADGVVCSREAWHVYGRAIVKEVPIKLLILDDVNPLYTVTELGPGWNVRMRFPDLDALRVGMDNSFPGDWWDYFMRVVGEDWEDIRKDRGRVIDTVADAALLWARETSKKQRRKRR